MFFSGKGKLLFISVLFSVTGFFYGCAFDDTMMTGTAEKRAFSRSTNRAPSASCS